MEITTPAGWRVESQSETTLNCIHTKHSIEITISPIYHSRNQSGGSRGAKPKSFRVNLTQDWFSEGILGDIKKAAKTDTYEEAIVQAIEFMEAFATSEHKQSSQEDSEGSSQSAIPSDRSERVSTGVAGIDQILGGGFPSNRTILATGTPGTGKSTLAMQFLQAGLENDERCLYISTEQTRDEIIDSFSGFDFDLDHDQLAITTIHAIGDTDSTNLQLSSLDTSEDSSAGGDFSRENILEFIRQGRSTDRIVLDSVSGLRPVSENEDEYRRVILDLIQLFNDEFQATALMTSEYFGTAPGTMNQTEGIERQNAVQYTTHGVIRLWREQISGEYHRFVDVMKMRGVDHDARAFEAYIDESGLNVMAGMRSFTRQASEVSHLPTGIDTLDEMLGGGLLRGSGVLLEHDERSSTMPLLLGLSTAALDSMVSLVIIPGSDTNPQQVTELFDEMGTAMERLLQRDQLFVIDPYGVWNRRREESTNIFAMPKTSEELKNLYQEIDKRSRGRGTVYLTDIPAVVHNVGPEIAQDIRYWQEASLLGADDILIELTNPDLLDERTSAFYAENARQIITQWVTESGLQYLKVRKGSATSQGTVSLVEFLTTPPYLRLH